MHTPTLLSYFIYFVFIQFLLCGCLRAAKTKLAKLTMPGYQSAHLSRNAQTVANCTERTVDLSIETRKYMGF